MHQRGLSRPERHRGRRAQREAIIRLIRDHPEGLGPNDVARALDMEPNAAQTTMSRMVSAGQLLRVEQGRYRLPAHVPADLLSGAEGGSTNGNGETTEP
jgi:predicted transcriptional regulator of viral defense system